MSVVLKSRILQSVSQLSAVCEGETVLARGNRGQATRGIQRGLVALGYPLRGGADGVFGPSTEKNVREFRTLHGQLGVPVVDAATLELLDQSLLRLEHAETYTLKSPRFVDDSHLNKVLAGNPLPRKAPAVKRIQQALLDLLFTLPRWGADGILGKETGDAIRHFQKWKKIRPGGELTPVTLMTLDETVPPPDQQVIRFPEYDRLISDGLLTVTIGVGYDEDNNDTVQLPKLEAGLRAAGFDHDESAADDAVKIYRRPLIGRTGTMRIRLVSRYTATPEKNFATGLVQDAVTIYLGHARYGTGPDFDDKESPKENFVIGVGAPQHLTGELEPGYNPHMNQILAGIPNDLLAHRFDPQLDQLWMFLGCTTTNYLDELRTIVENKDSQNLDLLLSTRPLYWSDMAFYGLEILNVLLNAGSINSLHQKLCAHADQSEPNSNYVTDAFLLDGFGDNALG
jgi:peptidoglycan hydrolase-like protein with peptidoglycan-binding domain